MEDENKILNKTKRIFKPNDVWKQKNKFAFGSLRILLKYLIKCGGF